MQLPATILAIIFFTGLAFNPVHNSSAKAQELKFEMPVIAFRTGDVVLRNGKGFISGFFRNTSLQKKEYSHAGILIKEGTETYVVHMIGDGIASGLKKETFADFCSVENNTDFAVYRYALLPQQFHKICSFIQKTEAAHIPFDDHFDLATDSALYCTELILKSFSAAGYHLESSEMNGKKYLAIDDLYVRNKTDLIFEYHY